MQNINKYNQMKTLHEVINTVVNKHGKRIYIKPVENDLPLLTFNDLKKFSMRFSGFLAYHGINEQDKVVVIMNNSTLMVLLFLSIIYHNVVFIPINPQMSKSEIDYIVKDSLPNMILCEKTFSPKVENKKIKQFSIDNHKEFFDIIYSQEIVENNQPKIHSNQIAEIVYTSGTTGKPKGVVITHKNMISNVVGIWERMNFNKEDIFLTITPLFHNSGQFFSTLVPLLIGARTTAVRHDTALLSFWYLIKDFSINWTLGMPTHINYLLTQEIKKKDTPLKGILVGGARLEDHNHKSFQKEFGVEIYKTYGLTETCSFATCDGRDKKSRVVGSSGKPIMANEIQIFNPDSNKKVSNNTLGEIRIKGRNIFKEYLNKPNRTQKSFKNGWFCTGDQGYLDDNNNLFVIDRIDNMIIVGGENIYPAEIENLMPLLKGLTLGILASIPHNILGRELVLVYEGKMPDKDYQIWKNILKKNLTPFRIPKKFINVTDLGLTNIPKSPNGKILRGEINNLVIKHFS